MSRLRHSDAGNLLGSLTIGLILLKLCKIIDWSWWWILLPIYGIVVLTIVVGVIGHILGAIMDERNSKLDK